jgi:L-threonylcarbamoyladenylate synthase
LSSFEELTKVAIEINETAARLAKRYWPGPLTLVVARNPDLPDILAPLPTIGVRVPDHPVALSLLSQTGPLAVTSANLSGSSNARTAKEVMKQLRGRIHLILDGGRTPGGVPSTVADCTSLDPVILRPGPISEEALIAISSQT